MLGGTRHRQSKVDTSKTAFRTLLPQLIVPAHRKNLPDWRFWACRARRASGVSVTLLPRPKNKLPAIPTSGASFPQATETKNLVLRDLIARRAEDARAVVTWYLSRHHTEGIRKMYHLIYRKAYPLLR